MITKLENESFWSSYKSFKGWRRHLLTALFIMGGCLPITVAQDRLLSSKNFISLTALGPGTFYSVNYGRVFYQKKSFKLMGKIGFSSFRLKDFTNAFNPDVVFPLGLDITHGNQHQLITGFGNTTSSLVKFSSQNFKPERDWEHHGYLLLGYRYQKQRSPYFFSVAYSPLMERYRFFKHWLTLDIGRLF